MAERGTRNQAAYSAGRNMSVNIVATSNPPIMLTAIGPRKTRCVRAGSWPVWQLMPLEPQGGRGGRASYNSVPRLKACGQIVINLVDQDHGIAHDHAGQRK